MGLLSLFLLMSRRLSYGLYDPQVLNLRDDPDSIIISLLTSSLGTFSGGRSTESAIPREYLYNDGTQRTSFVGLCLQDVEAGVVYMSRRILTAMDISGPAPPDTILTKPTAFEAESRYSNRLLLIHLRQ